MNLRQYEYALAVAEEGSMTAAAERLRVTQPSLSQQIGTLEKHLGVQLFTRTPSGVGRKLFGFTLVPPRARIASSGAYPFDRAARADPGAGS